MLLGREGARGRGAGRLCSANGRLHAGPRACMRMHRWRGPPRCHSSQRAREAQHVRQPQRAQRTSARSASAAARPQKRYSHPACMCSSSHHCAHSVYTEVWLRKASRVGRYTAQRSGGGQAGALRFWRFILLMNIHLFRGATMQAGHCLQGASFQSAGGHPQLAAASELGIRSVHTVVQHPGDAHRRLAATRPRLGRSRSP